MWGALYVLRVLTRKYEFKDEEERAPLAPVVTAAFPPLLAMLQVRAKRATTERRQGLAGTHVDPLVDLFKMPGVAPCLTIA